MEIDAYFGLGMPLATAGEMARQAEDAGFRALWTVEAQSDPFPSLALASASTERISIGTGVTIALARNPMLLAQVAHELQDYSGGRLLLGIGSQVKAHIERRFSATWSNPAARMREFILAMRAIWATWDDGAPLDFRGDFYQHTLMTPFFAQPASPHGSPPILLAAVGKRMTAVAGEVADGLLVHPLSSPEYLRDVTLPMVSEGLGIARRDRATFTVASPVLVATGHGPALDEAIAQVRRQIAFYASTPAYRGVLELHGLGELAPLLSAGAKAGDWLGIAELIPDDFLERVAVVGPPGEVVAKLRDRFDGLLDRASLYAPYQVAPEVWVEAIAGA